MRIAVDARALLADRGVTRYIRCLLEALVQEHPGDEWRLFVPGRSPLGDTAALERAANLVIERHRLPGRLLFGAAALTGRPRLDRLLGGDLDVVWAPTIAPLALSGATPFVLSVQDLSFELRPGDFTPYERLWHRLARPRRLARSAERVIVMAPTTRDQLIERWGVDPGTVSVIPGGVHRAAEPVDLAAALARRSLRPHGYLLAVGALEPRKAPLLLQQAFTQARHRGLRSELVFAGAGRLGEALTAPGVKPLGYVDDAELDALYTGALALVSPSLLEGYGLPAREALARGVPAIVSDLPVYGEELSDALLRVPAGDAASLADALLRIEREPGLRDALSAAGPPAVADLTWRVAARRTRALLAAACGADAGLVSGSAKDPG